jgi:hypothetical protein
MLYQLSHFRPLSLPDPGSAPGRLGAESQNRTGDTAIFSRVLYQLSYLGPSTGPASAVRRRSKDSTLYSRPAKPLASRLSSGGWPLRARRRLMRSRIGGWVEKRFWLPESFLMGLTM